MFNMEILTMIDVVGGNIIKNTNNTNGYIKQG